MNTADCKFTAEEIENKIKDRFWYHRIELPHNIITSGTLPFGEWHVPRYCIPERLDGLRVLDIGAWDGFWSFEALKRGAREVVAIDDFSDFLGDLMDTERYAWENFDICKEILGYTDEQIQRHELSVYDLTEDHFGRFDIVFFFGTLYHLKYPLYAIDKISAVCDQAVYIETAACNHYSPYKRGGYPEMHMVMEYYPEDEYGSNDTNWWAPTLACLCNMVKSSGFKDIFASLLTDEPEGINTARGFVQGFKEGSKIQPVPKKY